MIDIPDLILNTIFTLEFVLRAENDGSLLSIAKESENVLEF